jgi:hypothetical protein
MTLTPLPNGGFETAGPEPGDAQGWDVITKATVEEYAEFAGPPSIPFDGFELGWDNDDYLLELGPGDVEAALFGPAIPPVGFDDMETGWDNDSWGDELLNPIAASFDAGTPEDFEDFEQEWDSNGSFLWRFTRPSVWIQAVDADGSITVTVRLKETEIEATYTVQAGDAPSDAASALASLIDAAAGISAVHPSAQYGADAFDVRDDADVGSKEIQLSIYVTEGNEATVVEWPASSTVLDFADFDIATPQDVEDFEEEWRDNENYKFAFVGVGADLALASFDVGTPELFEDFEEEFPTLVMQTI